MFDPIQHQLEIRLMAIRRWQDELGKADAEPDPVEKARRQVDAKRQIGAAWDALVAELNYDNQCVKHAWEWYMDGTVC